jgi:hypothetical protein
MSSQKRRMRVLEHAREVRALAEAKFAQREARLAAERDEFHSLERDRANFDTLVAEEREKIIKEFRAGRPVDVFRL